MIFQTKLELVANNNLFLLIVDIIYDGSADLETHVVWSSGDLKRSTDIYKLPVFQAGILVLK